MDAQKVRKQKYGEEIPNSYNDASNMDAKWFQSEDTEAHGILSFDTWERIAQNLVTPEMWRRALRAHRIYDIKRPPTMRKKNHLVADGSRASTELLGAFPFPEWVKYSTGDIFIRKYVSAFYF